MTHRILKLPLLLSLLFASGLAAAPITWIETVDIESPADISTRGVHVLAINATADGLSPVVEVGGELIEFIGEPFPTPTTPTSNFFTFEGGDTGSFELNQVMNSQAFGSNGWEFEVFSLVPGMEYQIQIIAGGDTRPPFAGITQRASDTETPPNISPDIRRSGVGSAIGVFVADTPVQRIRMLQGLEQPQLPAISGYVLRQLLPPTPPSDLDLSHSEIGQQTTSGQLVAHLIGTDPNDDPLTFGLGDSDDFPDNLSFAVEGNHLLAATDLGEVGTTYLISLRAVDPGGLSREEQFTLTVTALPPIESIRRGVSTTTITMPGVLNRRVGIAFSPDLQQGSWIELGNFSDSDGMLRFEDVDIGRNTADRGYYRSFLRPLVP